MGRWISQNIVQNVKAAGVNIFKELGLDFYLTENL